MRWCIRSVFGTEVYQEAGRLLTFTCYITLICVLCISYVCATQNGISIILITCSLWCVSSVDSFCSRWWQLWVCALLTLQKWSAASPGRKCLRFLPKRGDKLFSRSRVQDKHSKVSSMPAALYLGPHIITGQQQLLTTTEKSQWQFSGLYLLFFQGDVIVWLKAGASKCALFFTGIGCGEEVGWMGRDIPDNCLFFTQPQFYTWKCVNLRLKLSRNKTVCKNYTVCEAFFLRLN